MAQAYYAREQGIERVTTETGAGQWGSALALACSMMGIDCTVYMVRVSYDQKPFRKGVMQLYNSTIHASPSTNTEVGRKVSEAVEDALSDDNVRYTLGSVLNHVILHQTVIGQEIKTQLEIAEEEPDTMIACVGGGSNFGGAMFPFMKDKIDGNSDTEFIAVEPSACPTLTQGSYDYDFGDNVGFTRACRRTQIPWNEHTSIPPDS